MFHCTTILCKLNFNRGRISSVDRVLGCRVGGQKFNSRGRTNTQDLLKWLRNEDMAFLPCCCIWLDLCVARMHDHVKWPKYRRKNSVPNHYFRSEYIDTQIKCFPFFSVFFFFISNHLRSVCCHSVFGKTCQPHFVASSWNRMLRKDVLISWVRNIPWSSQKTKDFRQEIIWDC